MGKMQHVVLWALQIRLALLFLMAGLLKPTGAEQMVKMFDTIGGGKWFRFLTGGVEVVAALLLLIHASPESARCYLSAR